jgi:hypothetical protein
MEWPSPAMEPGYAIIERGLFGGTCINTGYAPTKTLVASAYLAHLVRRGSEFGVTIGGPVNIDMKQIFGTGGDEAVHCILDLMYVRVPYTTCNGSCTGAEFSCAACWTICRPVDRRIDAVGPRRPRWPTGFVDFTARVAGSLQLKEEISCP